MPEESMRKAFEQAVREKFHVCMVDFARAGDGYQNPVNDYMWWAWQQSREVLVIELPKPDPHYDPDASLTLSECRAVIEAAGLKVKS